MQDSMKPPGGGARRSTSTGSRKRTSGKKDQVKVASMADYWGGGGKLVLNESAFVAIVFEALQEMQTVGHLNGEEEKKKGKKGKKKK